MLKILKVMLKRKWLNKVLNAKYMTLSILKSNFLIFLEFIINLSASLQNIVEKHQFNIILSHFKQKFQQLLVEDHLLAHHLQRPLRHVDFSPKKTFVGINCLALHFNMFYFIKISIEI
jgi:hypothetical protein